MNSLKKLLNLNTNDVIKWTATVFTLAGSLCVSLSIDPLNVILLNLGAILYTWWGFRIKEKCIITVNSGLLAIYLFGLFLRV